MAEQWQKVAAMFLILQPARVVANYNFPQSVLQRHDFDGRATLRPIILQQSGKAVVTSRKWNYVVAPAEF